MRRIKEWWITLWLGDTCKKCGYRMGKHSVKRDSVNVPGEHVDRVLPLTSWICP